MSSVDFLVCPGITDVALLEGVDALVDDDVALAEGDDVSVLTCLVSFCLVSSWFVSVFGPLESFRINCLFLSVT